MLILRWFWIADLFTRTNYHKSTQKVKRLGFFCLVRRLLMFRFKLVHTLFEEDTSVIHSSCRLSYYYAINEVLDGSSYIDCLEFLLLNHNMRSGWIICLLTSFFLLPGTSCELSLNSASKLISSYYYTTTVYNKVTTPLQTSWFCRLCSNNCCSSMWEIHVNQLQVATGMQTVYKKARC